MFCANWHKSLEKSQIDIVTPVLIGDGARVDIVTPVLSGDGAGVDIVTLELIGDGARVSSASLQALVYKLPPNELHRFGRVDAIDVDEHRTYKLPSKPGNEQYWHPATAQS